MVETDETLWQAYRQGDAVAFATLVRRYDRDLFLFLVRFVNNAELAEDLVQDTFLQIHASQDTFDQSRAFRPWLFTVAANKARDRLRQRQRRPEVLAAPPEPPGSGEYNPSALFDYLGRSGVRPEIDVESRETAERVRAVMDQMPAQLKEVLLMAYFHQFPYRDIAAMLGLPVGTVKSRVHHAVKWFAEHWTDRPDEREAPRSVSGRSTS